MRLRDGATGAGARVGGVRGLGGMAARLRCMMVSGLAACVALALLLTVAEPAAGAWNWSFQSVPAPAVHVGQLSGVSCTSRGPRSGAADVRGPRDVCTAVGHYTNSDGRDLTLAERWDGTRWRIVRTRNPSDDSHVFTGVSCTSRRACTAVGYSVTSTGINDYRTVTLAERWNGTQWVVQPTPNPAHAIISQLTGVSCTSRRACTAVGYSVSATGAVTLAERWNGSKWVLEPTANPAGTSASQLDGVSCTSSMACTAVGHYSASDNQAVALAERWNGAVWTIQPTPSPPGGQGDSLSGVSCTSRRACTAVGHYLDSSFDITALAERWNGSSWAIEPTANLAFATLDGVSCASPRACTAVGHHIDGTTLVEHSNGDRWTVQRSPNPTGPSTNSFLRGVSCTRKRRCTAVGEFAQWFSRGAPLAERSTRAGWVIQPIQGRAITSESYLDRVSCTSPTACTAVGQFFSDSGRSETLAERWNGAGWTIQRPLNAPGVSMSVLRGVSCTSNAACTAVGYFWSLVDGAAGTLVERWNGSAWVRQPSPDRPGATLVAVSCTSSRACTAVGSYSPNGASTLTLAERWNGTDWAIQRTPNPADTILSELNAVSCTSSTACTAVGHSSTASGDDVTLAERWDGSEWTIQSTPKASGSFLYGVSCTSSSACTGVGQFVDRDLLTNATLAERWNGTRWTTQRTPNPPNASFNRLDGVSCGSITTCTAVGFSSGIETVTLAQHWNGGRWAIERTPNPHGSHDATLTDVSCVSSTACTAVGYFSAPSALAGGLPRPLAEQYSTVARVR